MRRDPAAWLWPGCAAVLFAAFVVLACLGRCESGLSSWDVGVTDTFVSWRDATRTGTFWVFTLLGNDSLVAPLAASFVLLVGAWGKSFRASAITCGMAASWVAIHVAKAVVGRARPPAVLALIEMPGSHSMPSGHALVGAVFCGLVAYVILRPGTARGARTPAHGPPARCGTGMRDGPAVLRWLAGAVVVLVAAVVALAMGVSRVYLGVHWMSDVLAGWCLGGVILAATVSVATHWERRGGPRLFRGLRPWGRRSRAVLVTVVTAVIVAAAALTVWTDPLL